VSPFSISMRMPPAEASGSIGNSAQHAARSSGASPARRSACDVSGKPLYIITKPEMHHSVMITPSTTPT
jgi:hypothetical protein